MDLEALSQRILDTDFGLEVLHSSEDPPPDEFMMDEETHEDYLEHYGVLGMKWGVRKQRVYKGKTARREGESDESYQNRMKQYEQNEQMKREMKLKKQAIASQERQQKRQLREQANNQKRMLKSQQKVAREQIKANERKEEAARKEQLRREEKAEKERAKQLAKQTKSHNKAKDEKKAVSQMSDQELRDAIARMQLERQFKQVSKKPDSPAVALGKQILMGSAKNIATAYITKYATKGIDKLIGNASKAKDEAKKKEIKGESKKNGNDDILSMIKELEERDRKEKGGYGNY